MDEKRATPGHGAMRLMRFLAPDDQWSDDDELGAPEPENATPAQRAEAEQAIAAQLEKARQAEAWPARRRASTSPALSTPAGFVAIASRFGKNTLYFHEGDANHSRPAFEDRGRQVLVMEDSETTILAAMELASAKWGTVQVVGDDAFKRICAALAAKNGIRLMNPDLQAPSASTPTAGERSQPAVASAAAPVAAALPARAAAEGSFRDALPPRSQTFFRDLLVDAGFNLAQVSVEWPDDHIVAIRPVSDADLDRMVDLCRRAGVTTLRHGAYEVDIAAASAARAVLKEVSHQALQDDARGTGSAQVAGYALARYLDELVLPDEADIGALLPKGFLDRANESVAFKEAFEEGLRSATPAQEQDTAHNGAGGMRM